MATFSYTGGPITLSGGSGPFPGGSGIFICSTTAVDGTGTQSNGLLLVYRATKKMKYYRDATVWLPLGRNKPATEVGQYSFRSFDVAAAYPGTGKDYDGVTPVSRDVLEGRITAIISALQSGGFLEYQDARGTVGAPRHFYGTFAADPELSDESVLWTSLTFTFVEVGTG